jgi:hypothetical protein
MTFHNLSFTRANAGVFVLVDLAPFLVRIAPPSAGTTEQLDCGVAAMLREKVFLVCSEPRYLSQPIHLYFSETNKPDGGPDPDPISINLHPAEGYYEGG